MAALKQTKHTPSLMNQTVSHTEQQSGDWLIVSFPQHLQDYVQLRSHCSFHVPIWNVTTLYSVMQGWQIQTVIGQVGRWHTGDRGCQADEKSCNACRKAFPMPSFSGAMELVFLAKSHQSWSQTFLLAQGKPHRRREGLETRAGLTWINTLNVCTGNFIEVLRSMTMKMATQTLLSSEAIELAMEYRKLKLAHVG